MPHEFLARIRTDGPVSFSESLLISLELFWHGQPYYEDILGMTDASGEARLAGDELSRHFAKDQSLFPMDYKVPLEECDTRVRVGIRGGTDFESALSRIATSPMVDPEVRAAYVRAQNPQYQSRWVDLDLTKSSERVIADIELKRRQ